MSTQNERELARYRLAQALGDAYDCNRVWEAWSYGTMSQDDFSMVAEDDDRLYEIVEAVCAPLLSSIAELEKQVAEFETKWDETDAALAEAESRIDALSKDAEWQPIETAPKTGRTILIGYFNKLGNWRTMRGEWFSREYIDEYFEDPDMVEPGWYEVTVEADESPNCWPTNPTHWKPLPKPPAIDTAISAREGE